MSLYSERRGLSVPSVLVSVAIPAVVWWVCLATDSLIFAWSGAAVTALAVWAITARRAFEQVEVTHGALQVGRASLEPQWFGKVESLAGDAWDQAVRKTDPQCSWISLRSFHDGGVRIENTDPADPFNIWLVSSRNPVALAAAIDKTGERLGDIEDRTHSDG